MVLLDELDWARRPPSEEGDGDVIAEPGLDPATIEAVERRVGAPLPADLRALLGACHGIRGLPWEVDFTGQLAFEMTELFPHGMPIVGDHTGNFWVVDCTRTPEAEAPIFYACHDPPVLVWQCRGVATLLQELRRTFTSQERSALHVMQDEQALRVWRHPLAALERQDAVDAPDETVRAFAAALSDEWSIVDLRAGTPGSGFAWGRCNYPAGVRRFGDERLFACARPARRRGLLSRLLGR